MRIATVLAVVSAYGAFVDALNQDGADHAMLRDLSATNNENLSEVTPLSFLSAYAYNPDPYATCSWGPNVCELTAPTNSLKLGSTCAVDVPVPSDNYVGDKRVNKYDNALDRPITQFYDTGPAAFAGTCFNSDGVKCNVDKLKNNPFNTVENIKRPVLELEKSLNDKCSWCCSKSIALKELYTEYTCPSTTTQPPSTCEGLPTSTCGFDACIKATGKDVAEATITLKDSVQEASKKIIKELEKPDNTDVTNTIHYSLPCTSYDELAPTTSFVTDLALNSEKPSDYVFWRFKSGSKDWATWDPKNDAELSFKASSTTVNVEAWTACGQIASIEIVIKLYLHRSLTCDKFTDMWTPLVTKVYGEDTYCNVPDSDFSLFNLNYDYDVVIPPVVGQELERLKGTYKHVKCDIRVRESTAAEYSVNPAILVGETNENKINKNFAVELVHDPHTAPKSVFRNYITCFHSFTITDCDKPRIEPGVEEEDVCAYDCADKEKPGAYEACGGTIVSSKGDKTFVKKPAQETCCDDCDPDLNCVAFGSTEVKRCEVPSAYPYYSRLSAAEQTVFASGKTTAMALLAASAMVAVVALVVVKRRTSRPQETDDAYYPLLEEPAAFALTLTLSIMEQLEICDQSVAVASTWLLENEWQDLLEASQEEDDGEDVTIATNVTPNVTSAAPVMTQPVGEEGEPARQGGIMVVSTEAPRGREEDFESEDEDEEDGDEEDMYYDSEDEGVSMVERILPLAKRIKITTLREEGDEIKTDDFWVAFDGKKTEILFMAEDDPDLFCSWQNGLWCNLDTAANNLKLGEVNKCELPVPDPQRSSTTTSTVRTLIFTKESKAAVHPDHVNQARIVNNVSTKQTLWSQYLANPALVQSEIKFDAPGLYDVETIGTGYNHKAVCTGCVAIFDKFRPRFGSSGSCPLTAGIANPQRLTKTTLAAFQSYDTDYRAYTADTNVVNNANSDVLCGVSGVDKFARFKLFYESEKDCTGSCFDDAAIATNMAKLKSTPFPNALQTPFALLEAALNAQCMWCCRKTRKLKEQFTPYDCSAYSSQVSSCVGDTAIPSTCSIDVCLQAKGADVVTTTVAIKNTIQTATTAVLNTLTNKPAGIDATKNVYYTIPCSSFDKFNAKCRYTVKLSELLDVPTAFVTSFPTPSSESTNSKNYVFWRYNTDGSTFVKWDPLADTAISFVDASTTVVLEAWTACGRVNQFSFSVNLVVQNALTCSKFDSMWNFIEKYGIQGGEGAYCAYEGSDFAILKFDMAVADVLGQADSTGASTGVKCDIMVKETGAADTQVVTLVDDQISSRISKNYGVELVNNPTTAQKTTGVIHCKFTRAIQSNTRPELNCGKKEDMCSVRCAGDPAPGVYEACGGSIVASSATNTFLKTPTVPTCCNKCNKPLVCTSVSTTDIKRCEHSSISVLKLETATMAGSEPNFMTTTNMALLAATITLFAVVVLPSSTGRMTSNKETAIAFSSKDDDANTW
ncbi:hypothetical protein GQ600_10646 [Phytophthora cactorum]|nr:hypothetical protein GQ600_10646 [Phytophthora cactorum]